jgi:hypothetical protein
METTAGDTFSKMSAKDIGAPGGGEKLIGVVCNRLTAAGAASAGAIRKPTPAMAAAATPTPATAPTTNPVFLEAIFARFP